MTLPVSINLFRPTKVVPYAVAGTATDLLDAWATVDLQGLMVQGGPPGQHMAQYEGSWISVTFMDHVIATSEDGLPIIQDANARLAAFKQAHPGLFVGENMPAGGTQ